MDYWLTSIDFFNSVSAQTFWKVEPLFTCKKYSEWYEFKTNHQYEWYEFPVISWFMRRNYFSGQKLHSINSIGFIVTFLSQPKTTTLNRVNDVKIWSSIWFDDAKFWGLPKRGRSRHEFTDKPETQLTARKHWPNKFRIMDLYCSVVSNKSWGQMKAGALILLPTLNSSRWSRRIGGWKTRRRGK